MGKVQLKNAGVNGGTAIWLTVANVKFGWKNLTKANPALSKFNTVEAELGGFENPIINIQGIIDVDNVPTNGITQTLLINFSTEISNSTYLQIPVGDTPTYIRGFEQNPDGQTGWIRVQIMDWNLTLDSTSDRGHFLRYTLNLRETK